MERWIKIFGLVGLFAGLLFPSGLVNAQESPGSETSDVPYEMRYSGGEDLGVGNVQIKPELVDSLVPIVKAKEVDVTASTFPWADGYRVADGPADSTQCIKQKYFLVSKNNVPSSSRKIVSRAIGDKYSRVTNIVDIKFYDPNNVLGENDTMAVYTDGSFNMFDIYPTENDCVNRTNRVNTWDLSYSRDQGLALYAESATVLVENETGRVPKLDDVYLVLADIDASQSFKILNTGNELIRENMIVRNANDLLPDTDIAYRNKYVSSGAYIYSEGHFNIVNKKSHVYVPVKGNAWQNGVNIVYGFRNLAGSFTEYYSRQYKVEYKSDKNGKVTGIEKEDVLSGENPTGSKTQPNKNYEFTHWTCDKDVELEDGTVIKAGELLTPEQVESVVVHENLVFTAYHDTIPKIPDTGAFTGGTNAMRITTSIIAVMVGGLLVWFIPKLNHKKVKFDKH